MEHIDRGTYGAKVQSWEYHNPRALLADIIDGNLGLSKKEMLEVFRERVLEDEENGYINTIIESWFSNNYNSLIRRPQDGIVSAYERKTTQQNVAVIVEKHIERRAKIILLDLLMPNGKELRDCTGKDCGKLGPKVGKWLWKIAEKVKPNQKVGDALSESQVRKLYASS